MIEVLLVDLHVLEVAVELVDLLLAMVLDVVALERHLAIEDLLLALGGQIFPGAHRDGAGYGAGDGGQEHRSRVEATADHAGHQEEHRDQPVVDAEDDVAPVLAGLADVRDVLGCFGRCGFGGHTADRTAPARDFTS